MAGKSEGIARVDPAGLAAWAAPIIAIVFLALANGGYGAIARGVVGVAVWWALLVGTALGLLHGAGRTRSGWAMLILLAALAGWTALAFAWTESDERTAIELARVSTYLGVFALALSAQAAGRWRELFFGVTTAVALVCALAVLSRMQPSWFPEQVAGQYLPGIELERRLAYPLNYPSALGTFAAIALPLALAGASLARSLTGQALAAAAIPVAALALWLTVSGLSVVAAALGVGAFLLLAPDRIPKLATLAVATAASAVLFAAVEWREALDRGLPTPAAESEGDELLVITLIVCAGQALAQAGLGLWLRHGRRPAWLRISRRTASIATASALAVALVVAVAAGLPSAVEDQWESFKSREGANPAEASRGAQILDLSGSGRYQFWESAVDANATDPWVGIGPGTFDFWWVRTGGYAYVRDAHSLYVETLAELGIVGLVLVAALSVGILLIGAWRALRAPPDLRLGIAAATAGCAAFVAGALVDWMWELGVLPVVFFALAAVAVAGGAPAPGRRPARRRPGWRAHAGRIAIVVLSLAALAAVVPPLLGSVALQRSYDAAADGRVEDALEDARDAESAQPYAAGPRLQQALVLSRRGQPDAAARAAREATERERTNWRTWYILAEIEADLGRRSEAIRHLRRSRALNPRSSLFTETNPLYAELLAKRREPLAE